MIGASGGIGHALLQALQHSPAFSQVIGLGRRTLPALDLLDESSIQSAAADIAARGAPLRLLIDATGFLHDSHIKPERSWRDLNAAQMSQVFAINAVGPALLMKHFLPILPREGKSVFASLSAKVGSIGDNRLGGWYSYRASKAALNQFVKTAAVELHRHNPAALCVALHPGTVDTPLSRPFAKTGLDVRQPDTAADQLLKVLDQLSVGDSGGFYASTGGSLPW